DFRADTVVLLRVTKGKTVVFDAHVKARSRSRTSDGRNLHVAEPSSPLVEHLRRLLHKAASDGQMRVDQDAATTLDRLAHDGGGRPFSDVVVAIEQPGTENAVVVLVYDPTARTRDFVPARIFNGWCTAQGCFGYGNPGDCFEKGAAARLRSVA